MSHYYSHHHAAYGPPQQARYAYQSPPPPTAPPATSYFMDPVTFRREYTSRLAELTVNSRPIIQSLSMLAQDYTRFSDIVARSIENHIRSVPPWMKLPAFYLLDAVSKNVFEPYARQFAAFVVPLFLETYDLVDDQTRSKMEEMLLTWRTGSPHSRALFGSPAQYAIERGIWGDGASSSAAPQQNDAGRITKGQVLSELEYVLGQKERTLQANPYDRLAQEHIPILHQLRQLVETGVSQKELQQILQQLRSLAASQTQAAPPQPVVPPASQWVPPQAPAPQPLHVSPAPIPAAQIPQPPPPPFAYQAPESEPQPPAVNISALLSSLIKSGVVSTSGTPVNNSSSSNVNALDQVDVDREVVRSYRQMILSQPVTLTSAGIAKSRPHIPELLYERLSSQCKQCGIRFSDSNLGKKNLDDHLDTHFRQNRKANQDIGRGHSRSWFVSQDDWVHDTAASHKGKGRADGSRPLNAKEVAAAEAAKRDAELRAQYVVVPPGDEAKQIFCSICKEQIKSEFLEEDEDWVWKNAIMKDERIYHATCHHEALTSSNNLAARLRSDLAGQIRSRSATPEHRLGSAPPSASGSIRATPPSNVRKSSESPLPESAPAGVKRKAEETEPDDSEETGTPPVKKVALMASSS